MELIRTIGSGRENDAAALIRELKMENPLAWLEENLAPMRPVPGTRSFEGRTDLLKEAAENCDSATANLEISMRERLSDATRRGLTMVEVESYRQAGDDRANGVQSTMLHFAKRPITLFSARLHGKAPMPEVHLYSFTRFGGEFKYLGPMPAFKRLGSPGDVHDKVAGSREWNADEVLEWRLRDFDRFLESGKRPGDE
ncbi:MAG: hypothetical protein IT370_06920 [Deltaproteobacteria bacterium]|nr:hypothetical protein [Deltaproteobacteria bacterium]